MFNKIIGNIGANKLKKPIQVLAILVILMLMVLIVQSAFLYRALVDQRLQGSDSVTQEGSSEAVLADNQVLGVSTDTSGFSGINILGEIERNPFTDVPTDHISFTEITYLKATGVLSGDSDGLFYPNRTLSRVESIAMVTKAADTHSDHFTQNSFTDVTPKDWFYGLINTAYDVNLIDGFPDGTFRPYEPITQAGFLKLTLTAFNIDVSGYERPGLEWYEPYLTYSFQNRIISVSKPFHQITRAEGAEMLYNVVTSLPK